MDQPSNPYSPPTASLDTVPKGGPEPLSEVPPSVVALLAQTRPWVKLLAITFFVLVGLAAVAVVIFSMIAARAGKPSMIQFIPLVLVLLIYIPAVVFMWRYAAGIRRLQDGGGWAALADALGNQKSFWKYLGILAIVTLVFYALALVGGGFAALMARGRD